MNKFDGSMRVVDTQESQATQLIQAVLEKSPEHSEGRSKSTSTPSSIDNSIDSLSSSKVSASSNIHQYNYYGLVATQTQTQLNDEMNSPDSGPPPNEGSQKENFGISGGKTVKDAKWGMPSPDSQPSSPHKLTAKDNVTIPGRSGTPGRVVKPKPPTVAFQSPTKNPMPQKFGLQPTIIKGNHLPSGQRNNRSHSPSLSDDSFAQGDSQLAEEQFLVTSKKFTTPLVNLAPGDDDESGLSRRTQISHPSYLSRAVVRGGDDRPPVILVPSTPSQSGSSDHSGEDPSTGRATKVTPEEGSFERGHSVGRTLDNDTGKGSQYSQGFDGQEEVAEVQDLYSGLRDSRKAAQPQSSLSDAGFLQTQQATQVATQEELFVPATPSMIPQTNTSTHTSTGPRSLLNTMDPSKRNRYQHLIQSTPVSQKSSALQRFPTGTFQVNVDYASKQPTVLERMSPAQARPVRQRMHAPPSPRKPSPKQQRHSQLPPPTADAMDVVPDSEPSREQIQASVMEEHSLEMDKRDLEVRRAGPMDEGLSHDSEATEDSDVAVPMKLTVHQEKEEEEGEEERTGGDQRETGEGGGEVEKEETNDKDDDDEPLLARLRKGKGKAAAGPLVMREKAPRAVRTYESKSKPRKNQPSDPTDQRTHVQKGRYKNSKMLPADISHESAIPSSVPDQDHPRLGRSRKPPLRTAATAKDKGIQLQHTASRATSIAKSTRSGRSATVEVENAKDDEMEDASDGERTTEIAIDEEIGEDEDEDEYLQPEISQLKRKRGRPPKSKSLNQTMTTPRTRLNKRLKSAGSTITRKSGTRVFAMWQRNGLWYSGSIWEHNCDNNYMIKFDDGFEKIVNTDDMRTHNLRVGDLVRFGRKTKDYKIVNVIQGGDTVVIDIDGEKEELKVQDISVSTKEIKAAWQDRIIDGRAVLPALQQFDIKVKPVLSPTRSGSFLSAHNTKGPRQSYKFLQKVGLIVSLSGSNTNDKTKDGKSRSDILSAVRDSGGVVVDDLFKYLKMDISYSTNRWVAERSAVYWDGQPKELQRLFLLADDCNLKPKYLMALALGIPCVSVSWLFACLDAGRELDWRPHLLPQGRPTIIDALPSQQVDLTWGDQPEHLVNIMSNPVASKLLDGQSVLCVGPDMTPRNRDSDKAGEAANYIIRIILAMGASRVEAVRDTAFATNPLSHYDLLILRDKEQYTRDFVQVHTVDWNWVKDSLIMSRSLSLPSWSVEEDSQCSQSL